MEDSKEIHSAVLLIYGEKVHSCYFRMIQLEKIPFDKIAGFFAEYLNISLPSYQLISLSRVQPEEAKVGRFSSNYIESKMLQMVNILPE